MNDIYRATQEREQWLSVARAAVNRDTAWQIAD